MSLNSVIASFATGTYAVTRGTPGAAAFGRWVPSGTSVINVDMVIQPVNGNEMQTLPEAFHGVETRKAYTTVELFTITEGTTGIPADIVTIDSVGWTVISVQGWQRSLAGGNYFKAFLSRIIA